MNWYYDVISRYYPYNFLLALLSPTSYSLSRWTRNCVTRLVAHLRVAWAQCVYGFYFLSLFSLNDFVMPYYRRPYKRARGGKRIKYSVQQKAFQFNATAGTTTGQVIVPATTLEGMRKVKHLTINLTSSGTTPAPQFWWVLAYVPQGTTPGGISIGTSTAGTAMYEPNQFVMNCGIIDPDAGPIRISSPLGRNLNDGDGIVLLIKPNSTDNISIQGTCRYAISLQ